MTLTESLLSQILRFCSDHGMTERQFGLTVANNHKLISRLRAGYGVNSQTHDRIMAFIKARPAPKPKPKRSSTTRDLPSATEPTPPHRDEAA
jgi:hypothetical protein